MEKQRWEESEKRREEKKREEKKRKDAGAPKARKKSLNTVFFFGAQEGRQVGFLKRRVRSHLGR